MVLKKVRSNGMFLVSEGKEILPFISLQVMLQVFSLRLGVKTYFYFVSHRIPRNIRSSMTMS